MEIKTLYTLGKSLIEYDPSLPCLISIRRGFFISDEYRKYYNKALELFIEKSAHKQAGVVVDSRLSDATDENDLEWAAKDLTPRFYKAGLRHMAFIVSDDEYTICNTMVEVYMDQAELTKNAISTKQFTNLESAKAWLRKALNPQPGLVINNR